MINSVEYFIRKFGLYFYYTWNSDSEQRQKKMRTLYKVFLSQYTDLFYLLIWFIFIDSSSDGISPLAAMHL